MRILLLIFSVFCFGNLFSGEIKLAKSFVKCSHEACSFKKPNPIWVSFFKKQNHRKRIIASALAFPLPFGILGIHRIYLGTKPYIPLIYIGTFLGCAGLIPLIDFIHLISNKDISRFQNNPHIFMWIDNEPKK